MQQDTFSDAFSAINNAARNGNRYAEIEPTSDLVKNVLLKLQDMGYIGVFELVEDPKGGKFRVEVEPAINQCQSIKPRFSVQKGEYEKWAKRFLPAEGFGKILVTTSHGVMTHQEARQEGVGGKLLGYVY